MPKQNTHKPQKNSKTTTEVTDKPQKFQSLTVDNIYIVLGRGDPINSKYGTSYILSIKEKGSKKIFNIWSTKLLAKYIKEEKPQKAFEFTVRMNDKDIKYAEIKGYSTNRIHLFNDKEDSEDSE